MNKKPRWKVVAASAGALVASAVTLYTDLFGAEVKGTVDKSIKIAVIVVSVFASGYIKKDGVVGG